MRLVQLKYGEKMAKALKNKIIKSNKENKYIFDFIIDDIKNNCLKNTFIYNEGGIGKTTQLKKLVQMLLSPEGREYAPNIIPIYIAVKDLHGSKKENILFNSIKKFCGEDSSDEELENLLDGSSSLRKNIIFLFIIDGLNEAKDEIKKELQKEINDLMKFEQNIFIVSFRIDETNTFLGFEKKLFVKPLGNVCEILNVQKNGINPKLLEILSVPLYLKYYLDTYKKDNFDFYENKSVKKSDILSKYVQHIEKNLELNTVSYENDVMNFVINYYLPSLAFEVNNFVDFNEVLDVIDDEDYYRKFNVRTKKTAKYLQLDLFEIVVKTFALLNENTNSFVHDIWKEYFEALYYSKCIDKDIIEVFDNLPSEEVREFIGEITGECDFENVTEFEEAKKSPLNQFLQRHNLKQSLDKQLSDMQTRNIIEITKSNRNNYITGDYSNLDLSQCIFLNCDLPNSDFSNSILSMLSFMNLNDAYSFKDIIFSNDGNFVIILDGYDNIIIWDLKKNIISKIKKNEICERVPDKRITKIGIIGIDYTNYYCSLRIFSYVSSSIIVLIKAETPHFSTKRGIYTNEEYLETYIELDCRTKQITVHEYANNEKIDEFSNDDYNSNNVLNVLKQRTNNDLLGWKFKINDFFVDLEKEHERRNLIDVSYCRINDNIKDNYILENGIILKKTSKYGKNFFDIYDGKKFLKSINTEYFGVPIIHHIQTNSMLCICKSITTWDYFYGTDIIVWDLNDVHESQKLCVYNSSVSPAVKINEDTYVQAYNDSRIRFFRYNKESKRVVKVLNAAKILGGKLISMQSVGVKCLFIASKNGIWLYDVEKNRYKRILSQLDYNITNTLGLSNRIIIVEKNNNELEVILFDELLNFVKICNDELLQGICLETAEIKYEKEINSISFINNDLFVLINCESRKINSFDIDKRLKTDLFNYRTKLYKLSDDTLLFSGYSEEKEAVYLVKLNLKKHTIYLKKKFELIGYYREMFFDNNELYIFEEIDGKISVTLFSLIDSKNIKKYAILKYGDTILNELECFNFENSKVTFNKDDIIVQINDELFDNFASCSFESNVPSDITNSKFLNIKMSNEDDPSYFYYSLKQEGGIVPENSIDFNVINRKIRKIYGNPAIKLE